MSWVFKFGGSPPSWPWVTAKQRQVGPEIPGIDDPPWAAGPHNHRAFTAAVPPKNAAAVAPISNGGGPGLSE